MPVTFTKIQVTTLGSAQSSIDFQNIPATYTDLVLKVYARGGTGANWVNIGINNGSVDATNLKHILLFGTSTLAQAYDFFRTPIVASDGISNVYSNGEIYFTNYAGSNNKTMVGNGVQPSNTGSTAEIQIAGYRWPFTTAINRLTLFVDGGGNFDAKSSASLYGIKKD
jgi:hypothetical protein